MPSIIRNRLVVVVALSLIPALSFFILGGFRLDTASISLARASATRSAEALASQERLLLKSSEQLLRIFAASNAVHDMDILRISRFLTRLLAENPQYANLIATNSSGFVLASGVPIDPFSLADRGYLQEAIDKKSFVVGSYTISRSTGHPIIPMALPVLDEDGNITTVLIASLKIESLSSIVKDARQDQSIVWELLDRDNRRVFRYPADPIFQPGLAGDAELLAIVHRGTVQRDYDGTVFPAYYQGKNCFVFSVDIFMTELAIPSFRILYASQVNTQRIRYMSGIGNLLAAGLLSLLASIAMAALLYTRTLGKRLGKLVDQAAALAFDEKVVTWNPIDGEDEIELIQRVLSESTMELKRKEREQQEASKIIEGSLHEKEVLLKEIHHRVKNNFQIISSLLSLQTMSIEDEKIVHLLQESRDRIQSMALIHERLYRSENFSYIDFREYTESIAEQISSSYGTKYGSIRLEINADKVSLTLDSAIPSASYSMSS
ncbi:hypothetical protein MASR2M78_13340 [Treponema sp.]